MGPRRGGRGEGQGRYLGQGQCHRSRSAPYRIGNELIVPLAESGTSTVQIRASYF